MWKVSEIGDDSIFAVDCCQSLIETVGYAVNYNSGKDV